MIANAIKEIFVPDTDEIQKSIDSLKNKFNATFGFDTFDLSGVLGVSTEIANQTGTIKYGNKVYKGVVFDVKYLVKAINTFRPYIRGFLVIMMMIYNMNQFFYFIGAGPIHLGNNTDSDTMIDERK